MTAAAVFLGACALMILAVVALLAWAQLSEPRRADPARTAVLEAELADLDRLLG